MLLFKIFLANAAKCVLAKQGELCERGKSTRQKQISAILEHAKETGHLPIWDKVKAIFVALTGAHEGSRKLYIFDLERRKRARQRHKKGRDRDIKILD